MILCYNFQKNHLKAEMQFFTISLTRSIHIYNNFFRTRRLRGQMKQDQPLARHRWSMTVILATQEAEIRTMAVRSQPRQIVPETLCQNTQQETGLVEWLKR
jgi:hypothetical protein